MLEKILTQMLRYDRWLLWIGIPLVSLLMHWQVWGLPPTGPHVWRQTQTLQTIDSFVEEDFAIWNPRHLERGNGDGIFRMEFPLFQWLVAAVSKYVGGGVLVARILTMVVGLSATLGIHFFLLGLGRDRLTALIGSYLFAFSPVIYYYSITPLPDLLALAFAIWGSAFALRWPEGSKLRPMLWAVTLIGCGTLVKLPYIMFYAFPLAGILHALVARRAWREGFLAGACVVLSVLPAAAWYAWVMPKWSNVGAVTGLFTPGVDRTLVTSILSNHAIEMIPRTLMSVASLPLAAIGFYHALRVPWTASKKMRAGMLAAFAAAFGLYYLYELVMISYYHDYYMQPLTVLLIIPAAIGAARWLRAKPRIAPVIAVGLLLIVPYMTYRRIHPRWRPENAEFNRDWVTYRQQLRQAVPDDALVVAGPDVSHNIFLYYIHKKGWSWDDNQTLDATKLAQWRDNGAKFLYCSDCGAQRLANIGPLLGNPIAVLGTVQIFPLPATATPVRAGEK